MPSLAHKKRKMQKEHGMTLTMEEADPEEEVLLPPVILKNLVEVGYVLPMDQVALLVILRWMESLMVLMLVTKQRRLRR